MSSLSKVAKVSVALTPEMADMVNKAVASGEYASGSEVIREALREWKQRRSMNVSAYGELQNLWSEGVASGSGCFENMDAIKHEARQRFESLKTKG